jgi:hypothetical protein
MRENDLELTFERITDIRSTLIEIVNIKNTSSSVRSSHVKMPSIQVNKTIDIHFDDIKTPTRFNTQRSQKLDHSFKTNHNHTPSISMNNTRNSLVSQSIGLNPI